ncbi:asparaginyl-tRNA synthetase [Blastocystis sp. ATCC 50177/Nand II]|uniref:asparagine--tRNA ligase n=1 Tax=Blastocystis sp. subtype 1 (strain ATCC 50177 / NandII) TaxID=478820 RepID=A0A196SJ20_BLAHN|nr:asparaginyl-tRNA synthetase [Blastocystis sp. ATCC 50177/Nand II]
MSTEVVAPEVSDELHCPTVHPEVCKLVHQPEALWSRRRVLIRDILLTEDKGLSFVGKTVTVAGWTRTMREQGGGKFAFIVLNDGSTFDNLQCVMDSEKVANYKEVIKSGNVGVCLQIKGILVKSPAAGQSVELHCQEVTVLGACDAKTFPLAKKRHTLEHLRDIAHLRSRTNTIAAVARVRNSCAFATHLFFQERGFKYIHTPIITGADCEGAGEMFTVTTMLDENIKDIPATKDGKIDYSKDFFGKHAKMTVSGQLNVETYCCALSDVYTFGPTFRAENSHSVRHLAEFWMIEPEMAFADLTIDMEVAEDYVKFCTAYVMEHNADDLAFFEKQIEPGLHDRLKNVLESPFVRLPYTKAIEILTEAAKTVKFEVQPYWGLDLGSEHERYLTEQVFKKPVIMIDYPKEIKAFYMKLNEDGKTVRAMDILVPKIGELIGGSQREENLELLEKRIDELKMDKNGLQWYLDLRRYGSVPHSGFGLGFERLVMFVTGMENIRDVIPFPRWPKNASY